MILEPPPQIKREKKQTHIVGGKAARRQSSFGRAHADTYHTTTKSIQ